MDIEKTERINSLLDIYGNILTTKQKEVMEMYFHFDLSLAEISENLQVSRNAVFDLIKRTTKILENYEDKLMFLKKKEQVLALEEINKKTKEKIKKIL